jgi:PTS system mannitol-specific IIC component
MSFAEAPPVEGHGFKATIQRIGGNLAAMVMPNISAFLGWGLLTALFIPTGWLPNERLGQLVGPIVWILLPILIGYTGGRIMHGQRGAVVGAMATMGIVVGAVDLLRGDVDGVNLPMFLGAMIIGPLAGYLMKHIDDFTRSRTKVGFEMLVENFTAGILAAAMAILGLLVIGPVVEWLTELAGDGVEYLIDHSLLPLAAFLVEPAKVLFLNNAINHGVLGPLGIIEAAEEGKSILFLLEPNPGPGLGVLLAYWFWGPKALRPSVPAAIIIQFLGGIHEMYFPYVLMKPRLILSAIAGGASGVLTFLVMNAGLVATPSPGSIFAILAVAPRGGWFAVLAGVVVSTIVSFALSGALMGFGKNERVADEVAESMYADAQVASAANKPVKVAAEGS